MTYTLDANVLVALYDQNHIHHHSTLAVLDQAEPAVRYGGRGGAIGYMHAVNVAEMLYGYPEEARAGIFNDAFGEYRQQAATGLEVIDIPGDEEPFILARYRVPGRVRMTPDACAIAVAVWTHTTLVTYDDRLAAAAREQGLSVIDRHDAAAMGRD